MSPFARPAADIRRLVLVRHGQSHWNGEGRLQGHSGTGLTPLGRREAEATADLLAREYSDAVLIASSDLERVLETAAPAVERLGLRPRVDRRLREIDVGTWAGKTLTEIEAQDPESLAAWRRGEDIRRGGGETFAALRTRLAEALDDLWVAAGTGGTALVFTSGGPVRVAVAHALGLPPGGEAMLAGVHNGAITELRRRGMRTELVAFNRFDHVVDLAAVLAH